MYLIRLKPYSEESLSSFLSRLAHANGVSLIQLLKDASSPDYTLRTDRIYLIDQYPSLILNISYLSKRTELDKEGIYKLTFYYAISKFVHSKKESHSRVMRGLIRKDFCYCPHCLDDANYLRLQWGIVGRDICLKHQCYLRHTCLKCHSSLQWSTLLAGNCCPRCGTFLGTLPRNKEQVEINIPEQQWLERQWGYLLECSDASYSPENVAQKIMYVIHQQSPHLSLRDACNQLKMDYHELLQQIRGTHTIKRSVHISTLLNFLSQTTTDISSFLSNELPLHWSTYIESKDVIAIDQGATCIAPWCTFDPCKDQLCDTGTSYKKLKNNRVRRKYSFCSQCGCTYYFDEQGQQKEKDGYIEAFNMFQEEWRQLTPEHWRGSLKHIAFFRTRIISTVDSFVDQTLLNRFQQAVLEHMTLNHIKSWSCWKSESHYMMYRYHITILRLKHNLKKSLGPRLNFTLKRKELMDAVKQIKMRNESITLRNIASRIHISVATLRSWKEGYDLYLEAKRQQVSEVHQARTSELTNQIKKFLSDHRHKTLLIKEVYAHLNVRQSYLLKISPDVTFFISEAVRVHNNQSYHCGNEK